MDIEQNRQALGLPPRLSRGKRFAFSLLLIALVPTFLGGAGWLGGLLYRSYQVDLTQAATARIFTLVDTASLPEALRQIRRDTASLKQHRDTRMWLAMLYLNAAQRLPEQRLYWEEALAEMTETIALTPEAAADDLFELMSLRADLLHNLGREKEALAELLRCEKLLTALSGKSSTPSRASAWRRLNYNNGRAYFLASAKDLQVRQPDEALRLAREVLSSSVRDGAGRLPSESAAYVDTLAEAYFASGNSAQALIVQQTALALADGAGLIVYLEHYDKYLAASQSQ